MITYCNLEINREKYLLWFENEDHADKWLREHGFSFCQENDCYLTGHQATDAEAHVFTPHNEDKPSAFSVVEEALAVAKK